MYMFKMKKVVLNISRDRDVLATEVFFFFIFCQSHWHPRCLLPSATHPDYFTSLSKYTNGSHQGPPSPPPRTQHPPAHDPAVDVSTCSQFGARRCYGCQGIGQPAQSIATGHME